MRKILSFCLSAFLLISLPAAAQLKLGDNPTSIDTSALLQLDATNKGLLGPRMTAAQRSAISSPATGLLVYQTDGTAGFYYFDGATWQRLPVAAAGSTNTILNGTSNPTAAQGANGDFFINTTTNQIFGPKASGVWPAGVSLVGATGPQGPQGHATFTKVSV